MAGSDFTYPLATVLIPAYNPGYVHLSRSVRSALGQTYGNVQVLIVDDGSTDGSVARVAEELADQRLRVVSQANAGLSAALNRGLAEATGDIVVRLDADDVADPRRVASQVNVLAADRGVGIVGGQIRRIARQRPLSISRFPLEHDAIMAGLRRRAHVMSHPTIAFWLKDALELGGYWTHGVAEDWDFFLRMGEARQLRNVPEVVLDYTFHGESINSRQMASVRRNMRLAVSNHDRRQNGLPELTPEGFAQSLGAWERLTCRREVIALNSYRRHLQARATSRRSASVLNLFLSALAWPEQALRRVGTGIARTTSGRPEPD